MYILRCTQRLLRRMPHGEHADNEEPAPTTTLGDWYANPLNVGRLRLVLCISERSLLPVLVPARDLAALAIRLQDAVRRLLLRLGVDATRVQQELREMAWHRVGATRSRQLLGSLNDLGFLADAYIRAGGADMDLDNVALEVARASCRPIEYQSPDRRTQALFSGANQ